MRPFKPPYCLRAFLWPFRWDGVWALVLHFMLSMHSWRLDVFQSNSLCPWLSKMCWVLSCMWFSQPSLSGVIQDSIDHVHARVWIGYLYRHSSTGTCNARSHVSLFCKLCHNWPPYSLTALSDFSDPLKGAPPFALALVAFILILFSFCCCPCCPQHYVLNALSLYSLSPLPP